MKSRLNQLTPAATIPLTTKGRGITWTPELRRRFDRRMAKMTERYTSEIVGIAASLEDTNGPRGGVDKSCRLHLVLRRRRSVSVSASSADPEVAVSKAISRASGALLRKLRSVKGRRMRRVR